MALDTFGNLKTAVAQWLQRTDLTSDIPDFITLCEDEISRRVETEFERRDTITLDKEIITLPTDVREITSLALDDASRRGPIEILSPEQLTAYKAASGRSSSYPRKAAITTNGTELILAPVPDQAYIAEIIYATKLDRLSDAVTSNWILDDHSDVYLYGSLIHSAPFLKDDMRLTIWESRFEKALPQLAALIERRKWAANSLVMRPRRIIGEGSSVGLRRWYR